MPSAAGVGRVTDVVRIGVRVPPVEREEAIARLLEVVPEGFDERETGGLVELGAYVSRERCGIVRAAFPDAEVEGVSAGWEDAWREFHHGVTVGGLWVGPPWESPPAGASTVVIDPGRAFGTGAHPTTRLCLELLAELPQRGSVLDVGCGSGVLSIAAVRLGFAPVVAVDVDPVAVEVARTNAAANDVVIETRVIDATLDDSLTADVVIANIAFVTVQRVLERVDGDHALTAGHLASERPVAVGWRHARRLELEGWAADHFCRETV
jgi:ribosomal protein L11 methyltransferase